MGTHAHHRSRPRWRDVVRARLRRASAHRTRTYRDRSVGWRLLAPLVFVVAGALFVTSMVTAAGLDLRAGRYDDLGGLASDRAGTLEGLQAEAAALAREVDRLGRDLARASEDDTVRRAEALQQPAGLTPLTGPGVTITLDDAPEDALDAAGDDVSDLIVHQQDIQAVANALWAGGAEAMTLQDQRVVATTGIKCVGNTVVLHGVPYSPPYRITAVGPVAGMLDAVDASPYIELYLQLVPAGLGWDVQRHDEVTLPAYDGSTELDYARPLAG